MPARHYAVYDLRPRNHDRLLTEKPNSTVESDFLFVCCSETHTDTDTDPFIITVEFKHLRICVPTFTFNFYTIIATVYLRFGKY